MPFDRTEPAAWWQGANAAPPMPEEPGPWALTATPYGWEWRRPEPESEPGAADADTAGIIREGMRTLDRLARQAGAAGHPAYDAVFWARMARGAHERAGASQGSLGAMAVALRAADAVPDPRREAERRVIEVARHMVHCAMPGAHMALESALAALDGKPDPWAEGDDAG